MHPRVQANHSSNSPVDTPIQSGASNSATPCATSTTIASNSIHRSDAALEYRDNPNSPAAKFPSTTTTTMAADKEREVLRLSMRQTVMEMNTVRDQLDRLTSLDRLLGTQTALELQLKALALQNERQLKSYRQSAKCNKEQLEQQRKEVANVSKAIDSAIASIDTAERTTRQVRNSAVVIGTTVATAGFGFVAAVGIGTGIGTLANLTEQGTALALGTKSLDQAAKDFEEQLGMDLKSVVLSAGAARFAKAIAGSIKAGMWLQGAVGGGAGSAFGTVEQATEQCVVATYQFLKDHPPTNIDSLPKYFSAYIEALRDAGIAPKTMLSDGAIDLVAGAFSGMVGGGSEAIKAGTRSAIKKALADAIDVVSSIAIGTGSEFAKKDVVTLEGVVSEIGSAAAGVARGHAVSRKATALPPKDEAKTEVHERVQVSSPSVPPTTADRAPNQRYKVHLQGEEGTVRVSGDGKVEYVDNPELLRKMHEAALLEELHHVNLALPDHMRLSNVEIGFQARLDSENTTAFFDTKRDRLVVQTLPQAASAEESIQERRASGLTANHSVDPRSEGVSTSPGTALSHSTSSHTTSIHTTSTHTASPSSTANTAVQNRVVLIMKDRSGNTYEVGVGSVPTARQMLVAAITTGDVTTLRQHLSAPDITEINNLHQQYTNVQHSTGKLPPITIPDTSPVLLRLSSKVDFRSHEGIATIPAPQPIRFTSGEKTAQARHAVLETIRHVVTSPHTKIVAKVGTVIAEGNAHQIAQQWQRGTIDPAQIAEIQFEGRPSIRATSADSSMLLELVLKNIETNIYGSQANIHTAQNNSDLLNAVAATSAPLQKSRTLLSSPDFVAPQTIVIHGYLITPSAIRFGEASSDGMKRGWLETLKKACSDGDQIAAYDVARQGVIHGIPVKEVAEVLDGKKINLKGIIRAVQVPQTDYFGKPDQKNLEDVAGAVSYNLATTQRMNLMPEILHSGDDVIAAVVYRVGQSKAKQKVDPTIMESLNSHGLWAVTPQSLSGVRPSLGTDGMSHAFQHPEMRQYILRAQQLGYQVFIDPTMQAATGYGAYFKAEGQVRGVGLLPNSPWHYFRHEFSHLEYHAQVRTNSSTKLRAAFPEMTCLNELGDVGGWRLVDSLAQRELTPEYTQRIRSLFPQLIEAVALRKCGFPNDSSIDEFLAVREQLKLLKTDGYDKDNSAVTRQIEYALKHYLHGRMLARRPVANDDIQMARDFVTHYCLKGIWD